MLAQAVEQIERDRLREEASLHARLLVAVVREHAAQRPREQVHEAVQRKNEAWANGGKLTII